MGLVQLVRLGGPVIVFILIGSIVALTVFLERVVYLRRSFQLPDETLRRVRSFSSKDMSAFRNYLRGKPRPFHDVLITLLQWHGQPMSDVAEHISSYLLQVRQKLSRGVDALSTVASISPLMGLLGTVLGMWEVFKVISSERIVDPNKLAGGISEALLTTIAGLLVAIPAFIGFKLLNARVKNVMGVMENNLNTLIERIYTGEKTGS